jgi:glycosyltransferase involved in cell wall biosynthesis
MAVTTSVLFLAYNQRPLVREAVKSVLNQEGPPLEILLSDDASTDGTFDEIAALARDYRGPHHVVARRNEHNLGIGEHINTLVRESRGELLVVAAGDDISESTRVQRLQQAWLQSNCTLDLIATPLTAMDENGTLGATIAVDDLAQWRSLDDWLARKPYVIGAAHAWTRRLFDRFGPLLRDIAYEDQILVFRAICAGKALTLPEPLVRYRSGGTSARKPSRSAADRLRRLSVQNRRHLAELQQLLFDAGHTPFLSRMQEALEPELAKQEYLRNLLESPNWGTLGRAVLNPPRQVPLSWRWRKFWGVGSTRLRIGYGE